MKVAVIIASNVPNVDCGKLMRELGLKGGGRKDFARGEVEPWQMEAIRRAILDMGKAR